MTRVLVCGGRDFTDYHTLFEILDGQHKAEPFSALIEGGALGADRFARRWASERGVPVETFDADWKTYGRAAGPIRNGEMLVRGRPDRVIAFPRADGKIGDGTAGMVALARRAKLPVLEVIDG